MMFFNTFLSMVQGFIGPLGRYVRNRWLRTLIWAIAAALVIWFYGDIVRFGRWQPLDSDRARIIATAAIFAGWLAYNIYHAVRDRQRNAALIGALTETPAMSRDDMSAQEVDQMRTRLQDALNQMRKLTGGRRGYVYQLPWYVMIGPPGSGKSTALLNSGLKFPLAGKLGDEPIQGVGGTRNCDWWFTEDAILLDTAGRYTTQDSDAEMDKRGWTGFLNLLKTYRPLQPINGVIVALSLEDVAARDSGERLAAARAIRLRIDELGTAFGSRFPVYVLLTKADLMAGFVQFFDGFSRTDREQVWGMTFPLDDGKPTGTAPATRFAAEYTLLQERLNALLLERLQQELDIERRGLIYGFPTQMALLRDPIEELLNEIFTTSRYEQRPLLRGVYFCSGTQSGVPIDRMMHAMGQIFSMEVPRLPSFSGQGKSYFLTHLLDSVVFQEASLVSADPRVRGRMAMTRRLALAAAAVVLVGFIGAWGFAFAQNRALIASADEKIATYTASAKDIPTDNVSDIDFARIVPPLDMLRDDPARLRQDASFVTVHAGLDQSDKLQSQYQLVYARALDNLLLPRVLAFLQQQLRARANDVDFTAQALKVYLGLGGQGPLDPEFTRKWMQAEWAVRYPDPSAAAMRADLDDHFKALIDRPIVPIALDSKLIASARTVIAARPLAERAYAALRDGSDAAKLPVWRPIDKLGAIGARVFNRSSGAPLTDGIPGFFTRDGYLSVVLPGLQSAADAVAKDQWVYGEVVPNSGGQLSQEILALYRNDFATKWKTLLADLRIVPLTSQPQAIEALNALSGPDSVLRAIVIAITQATDLAPPSAEAKDPQSEQIRALVSAQTGTAAAPDDFAPLRAMLAGTDGQPSRMSDLLRTLDTLYQQLGRAANSAPSAGNLLQVEGSVTDANQALISQAGRQPPPVDGWMAALATNLQSLSSGGAKKTLSAMWAGNGERFCERATAGRYPFARGSRNDISLDDFTRLFGPGGVLDSFFNQNLRQFVNTGRHPWAWQYNSAQSVSSAAIAEFENADTIKQAFFGNSSTPSFHFEITPQTLDAQATAIQLNLGGTQISYAHGPVRPTTVQWPGSSDAGSRISIEPVTPGSAFTVPGIWSVFHLFDQSNIASHGRDTFTATFAIGAHSASFDVHSGTVLNPFTLRELRSFHCPNGL